MLNGPVFTVIIYQNACQIDFLVGNLTLLLLYTDTCPTCLSDKDPRRESLITELQEKEAALNECIEKLKLAEANRVALVTQLKEALWEQVCQCLNSISWIMHT